MESIRLKARAKINLGLDVIGRRENGYHDVRMVMQTVGLYDRIIMTRIPEEEIRIKTNIGFLPVNENNLVYKAIMLMKNKYKDCPEISVDYKNRHLNYNNQIEIIENLEKDGHALYRYPTETVNVTRLKGDKKDLIALYELGRKDMEASREEIYKLIK